MKPSNEQILRDALEGIIATSTLREDVPTSMRRNAVNAAQAALAATEPDTEQSAPSDSNSAVQLAKRMLGQPIPICYQGMNFSVYRSSDVHLVIGKIVESAPTDARSDLRALIAEAHRSGRFGTDENCSMYAERIIAGMHPAPSQSADQSPYEPITLANLRAGKLSAARVYVGYCELSEALKAANGAIKRYEDRARAAVTESAEASSFDQECMRIGQEVQRAAKILPEDWSIRIEIERGYGGAEISNPEGDKIEAFNAGDGDGLSYAITKCIEFATSSAAKGDKA
jgi:hypothetical protein